MLFQIFIPNTGFGSCAGLFENDWAVLFHLIVPKIITKKSQWKPVVSNIQITLKKNKQVLNDIRACKNASCIFLLLKINGNFDTHFHWDKTETNTGSLKKHNQTKTAPKPLNKPKGRNWTPHFSKVLTVLLKRKLSHSQNLCPEPLIDEILLLQAALCMWSLKPMERQADISGAPDGHEGPPTWSTAFQNEHLQ